MNTFLERLQAKAAESASKPEIVEDFGEEQLEITAEDIVLDTQEEIAVSAPEDAFGDLSSLRIGASDVVVDELASLQRVDAIAGVVLEVIPRKTIVRMLTETALDQPFTFYTKPGRGFDYVAAMRAVLSRTRKRAKGQHVILKQDFKLYTQSITTSKDFKFDEVKMCRSMSVNHRLNAHFDEIVRAMQ